MFRRKKPTNPENLEPKTIKDPVDQVPSPPKLTVLGVQHVLAFYAGAVIVPLVIAKGINLTPEQTIHLINADLFTCGIATIIQSVGFGKWIGVKLPIIQGVTTTALTPIIAIGLSVTNGQGGAEGLPYIYGSVIISGLFTFLAAPFFVKLLRFFPPVVTGTVLLVMGTSLLAVSANDFTNYATAKPALRDLAYAFGTLAIIILAQKFLTGFLSTIAVLLGLVIGTTVALGLGDTSFGKVSESEWLGVTTPFHYGLPAFSATGAISMIIVMIITMVETTGDVFATGEIVGRRITKRHVSSALRADGISTMLGGVMNSFPYTCFAQNVGLVRITQVKSRWVAVSAGAVMIILGLVPKAGAIVASIPAPVLGGASIAMFANVAFVGMQTLSGIDLRDTRNSVIITSSLGLAMLVSFKPNLASAFPEWSQIFFSSGMTMGAVTAILLNLLFFHLGRPSTSVSVDAKGNQIRLSDVNKMNKDEFVSAFRSLFNNQIWPLEEAYNRGPFKSIHELRQAIQEAVLTASPNLQKDLINDYPDMATLIGADENQAAEISKDIGSLALGSISAEDAESFAKLCAEYREKFNQPLVACLTPSDSFRRIVLNATRRLENSPTQERVVALSEVVEIANDRFNILLANANPVASAWAAKFKN